MELPEEIASELSEGQRALEDGNDGRARVCGRRAVVKAFVRSTYSKNASPAIDSVRCLKSIASTEELSGNVRAAAARLSTSVKDRDTQPFSTEPLKDAEVIIKALLGL